MINKQISENHPLVKIKVKLIPVFYYLNQFPDPEYAGKMEELILQRLHKVYINIISLEYAPVPITSVVKYNKLLKRYNF